MMPFTAVPLPSDVTMVQGVSGMLSHASAPRDATMTLHVGARWMALRRGALLLSTPCRAGEPSGDPVEFHRE